MGGTARLRAADHKTDAKRMEEQYSLPAMILKLDKGVEMPQVRDELVLVEIHWAGVCPGRRVR